MEGETAYRDFLLDKLATGDPSVGSVRIGNKEISYKPETLRSLLSDAEQRAAAESAGSTPTLRTYAGQGGRGA